MSKNLRIYLLLLLFTVAFSLPLFFYKLGASSLVSWDEAWYAAVSKNILISNNLLNLKFNDQPFVDHPPAGFWLMAVSMKIIGTGEFGVRFFSALCGTLTIALVFLLGRKIAAASVGLASSIALLSSPWFISRARSGNLDVPLTFFFVLTFYLAIKASSSRRFLIPFGISLAFLLLTKTLVPFTIIPSLFVIFWNSPSVFTPEMFFSMTITVTIALSWFISQLLSYPHFITRYFSIGLPQGAAKTSLSFNVNQTKAYLHYGIGTWFRPLVLTSPLGLLFVNRKYLISIILFILIFLTPFAFSSRGQIWHLIPVFPFLFLIFFSLLYFILNALFKDRKSLVSSVIIVLSLSLSQSQISKNWREFIDIPAYVSDEAILSREAGKFPYPLTIDDRFLPVAVYYSGKTVTDGSAPDVNSYFDSPNTQLLITHQWRLDNVKVSTSRYRILKTDRDMVLVLITTAP